MARGELMKRLLAGCGREDEFRSVAEEIIREEDASTAARSVVSSPNASTEADSPGLSSNTISSRVTVV